MSEQQATDVTPIDDWSRLLDGKIAVVSGGGSGIGEAISRLFAQHGASVEMAESDPDRCARTIQTILDAGGSVHGHNIDVTDAGAVNRMANEVIARQGRVDILVNNVGDYRPLVRFHESTPASWDAMYQLNLGHVLLMTRAFLDTMTRQGSGVIINVHSVEGMRGYPGDPVYAAMKAAVVHFTTSLAVSIGRSGVRVNGIGPDLTQTPQVDYLTGYEEHSDLWSSWAPVGRLGWPEDQARVALFLASDLSGFITGHNIPVDGGTKAAGGWYYSPTARRFVNRPAPL